jgi:hypothetical protein
MLRRVAILAMLFLTAVMPALADQFYVEANGWTVIKLGPQSCLAVNRPTDEFNYAPYDALALHQSAADEGSQVQVYFWPGAFKEGETIDLALTPARGDPFEYLATAQSDFQAVGTESMSADGLDAMAQAGSVEISVVDSPLPGLMFDTKALAQVRDWLAQCVE